MSTRSIHVGVVLDAKRVIWGICPAVPASQPSGMAVELPLKEGLATIREVVAPAFEGERLASFPEMASRLAELRAPSALTRSLPEEKTGGQVTRRELLTGQLYKRQAKEQVETVTVDGPLNPAIRFGVSEALLRALAATQDETIAEVLAEHYDLSLPRTIIPIHARVKRGHAIPLYPQLASLEFRLPGIDPERELGEDGVRFQRLTRRLSERIAEAAGGKGPALHLNVSGGLGQLYDNNLGKILGAFSGLRNAAAALTLRVEDPVLLDDPVARSRMLAELRDMVNFRQMPLQLVAGAGIEVFGDVETILNMAAADMVRLSMVRLGTIHETMAAITACREQGVSVLLSGGTIQMLSSVALASQPDLVAAPDGAAGIDELYGAMARTAAWLSSKRSKDN